MDLFTPACGLFPVLARSPRFTLFPYTTLFRSVQNVIKFFLRNFIRLFAVFKVAIQTIMERYRNVEVETYILKRKDRKSTRLNSSHVAISYGVFCLKKKKMTASRKNNNELPCTR